MDYLTLEKDKQGVVLLTLNRPEKLNVLNIGLMEELEKTFREMESDPGVRAVILTGAGEKAFAAGADIGELSLLDGPGGRERARAGQKLCDRIESFPRPVIAAINGYALGGGAEVALACHLRVAANRAQIGLPEITLGIIPGFGGTQRMTRLLGTARALEWILTGDRISADEAYRIGLVNRVVSLEETVPEARRLIRSMLKNAPLGITAALKAVYADSASGYEREAELFGELCDTDDFREGTQAFLEKRPPRFQGR